MQVVMCSGRLVPVGSYNACNSCSEHVVISDCSFREEYVAIVKSSAHHVLAIYS